MTPVERVLGLVRGVVANDSYSIAFQSFGQYRTALLQYIDKLDASQKTATQQQDDSMDNPIKMPLATTAYPYEHPYPTAVRRVNQLEQVLLSGLIVHLHELTRYSYTDKRMVIDAHGPWVTMADVMGQSRSTHKDDEAAASFTGQMLKRLATARKAGRHGWDTSFCTDARLASSLINNLLIGDLVDAAVYAMMLRARGAPTDTVRTAIEEQCAAAIQAPQQPASEATIQVSRDAAEVFAQALIAQGWHNASETCVDGLEELLATLLRTHQQVGQ